MVDPTRCTYRVYGLRLRANRRIPGLISVSNLESVDVHVELSGPGARDLQPAPQAVLYTSPGKTKDGEYFFKVWRREQSDDAHFCIRYTPDGKEYAEFAVTPDGSSVQVIWTEGLPHGDVASYLLGPVLGCVLRLRGMTCLHAGVVALGEAAIAIIGPKGMGKSVVVAALAQGGHAVLTDDIAPLVENEGAFFVQPGYPRLRLWPDAVEALTGLQADELPRVLSVIEKRYLDLTLDSAVSRWRFHPQPLPLAAVYVLGARSPGTVPSMASIPTARGLITLVTNAYVDYALDRVGRARDFEVLGRLAAIVPIRKVRWRDGWEALPSLCEAILEDLQMVSCATTQ